jgi:hypothetical protein
MLSCQSHSFSYLLVTAACVDYTPIEQGLSDFRIAGRDFALQSQYARRSCVCSSSIRGRASSAEDSLHRQKNKKGPCGPFCFSGRVRLRIRTLSDGRGGEAACPGAQRPSHPLRQSRRTVSTCRLRGCPRCADTSRSTRSHPSTQ